MKISFSLSWIPTDGGYRNVFALHSAIPVLTTAFSIPASPTLWRRGLLLIFVGGVGTFGFALSLWLNGYTFASVIEQRAVDEVILRTSMRMPCITSSGSKPVITTGLRYSSAKCS